MEGAPFLRVFRAYQIRTPQKGLLASAARAIALRALRRGRPMAAAGRSRSGLSSQFSTAVEPGREVRHASFDDVGVVSWLGALERTETGRTTQMAKLVDAFDWDKYSPDDLVQKDDSFQ